MAGRRTILVVAAAAALLLTPVGTTVAAVPPPPLPDGTYQVEYRDGSADEHYQSRTISRVKAANALASWAADTEGAGLWRSGFDWTPIGQWFTQD